jgi:hypothetical protein
LLIEADEAVLEDCADGAKYVWVFDVREKRNPISIATFPVPPIASADVFVDRRGLVYLTDGSCGLHILEFLL